MSISIKVSELTVLPVITGDDYIVLNDSGSTTTKRATIDALSRQVNIYLTSSVFPVASSSYSDFAISSSYSKSSSYSDFSFSGSYAKSASYAKSSSYSDSSLSSSYAKSASYANRASIADYANSFTFGGMAESASYASSSLSASYAKSASFAVSASHAVDYSHVESVQKFISTTHLNSMDMARVYNSLGGSTPGFHNLLVSMKVWGDIYSTAKNYLITADHYSPGQQPDPVGGVSLDGTAYNGWYEAQPLAATRNYAPINYNTDFSLEMSQSYALNGFGQMEQNNLYFRIRTDNFMGVTPPGANAVAILSFWFLDNARPPYTNWGDFVVEQLPDNETVSSLNLPSWPTAFVEVKNYKMTVSGSLLVERGITGSLNGTASYTLSSSYARSASYADYALNTVSSGVTTTDPIIQSISSGPVEESYEYISPSPIIIPLTKIKSSNPTNQFPVYIRMIGGGGGGGAYGGMGNGDDPKQADGAGGGGATVCLYLSPAEVQAMSSDLYFIVGGGGLAPAGTHGRRGYTGDDYRSGYYGTDGSPTYIYLNNTSSQKLHSAVAYGGKAPKAPDTVIGGLGGVATINTMAYPLDVGYNGINGYLGRRTDEGNGFNPRRLRSLSWGNPDTRIFNTPTPRLALYTIFYKELYWAQKEYNPVGFGQGGFTGEVRAPETYQSQNGVPGNIVLIYFPVS